MKRHKDRRQARAGVAGAMAMTQITPVQGKTFTIGAGVGIGRIGGQAMDAMARQPEKIGDLRSSMIIAAALIEGVAFLAVIVSILAIVM